MAARWHHAALRCSAAPRSARLRAREGCHPIRKPSTHADRRRAAGTAEAPYPSTRRQRDVTEDADAGHGPEYRHARARTPRSREKREQPQDPARGHDLRCPFTGCATSACRVIRGPRRACAAVRITSAQARSPSSMSEPIRIQSHGVSAGRASRRRPASRRPGRAARRRRTRSDVRAILVSLWSWGSLQRSRCDGANVGSVSPASDRRPSIPVSDVSDVEVPATWRREPVTASAGQSRACMRARS